MSDFEANWKHRRSFLTTFIHQQPILLASTSFSLSVACFLAWHLSYFSTFLIYLPLALACIPALAIYDAIYITSWTRWPQRRKWRFRLCVVWCLFLLFAPTYPYSSYLNHNTPIPTLAKTNGPYYIAANLYNSAGLLPSWTKEMTLLINHLGHEEVFVSIFESNSNDGTKSLLKNFEEALNKSAIPNKVVLKEGVKVRWGLNDPGRIRYLAGVRNEVLEPLRSMESEGKTFSKVIFFNDIYFDWRSIVHLINTNNGDYDQACALDFDGVGMYDTWVLRDACGRKAKEVWPYFASNANHAVDRIRNEEPIEVGTCWNGVAAFDAQWFMSNSTLASSLESNSNAESTNKPSLPLKFRDDPDCTSSECYLLGLDMHRWRKPERPKIYVNPRVSVAYNPLNYLFHTKLEHLTSAKPWQFIWQDLIGHRLFGWLTDRMWLGKDRCSEIHVARGDFVKAEWCPS
ncbi:hypothetical protein FA15DRAFT_620245 [Coprinopsis marcescibilis]|uniref:Capsular associated protein n=1 Tax=Coprinopsis marcescibilis TaxID=230819 RepID=A0A5C3KVD8_COPMA|nr:hypothetical protein FA15DRAFT_620245 [Coprinopsis marcescibilis]